MIFKELQIKCKPSLSDLSAIKKWLEEEIEESGEGFYVNWIIIEKAFYNNNLISLNYQSSSIGFVTFYKFEIHVDIGIFVIKPIHRRKGIGKIFYEKVAEYFKHQNYLAFKLFCSPTNSESFWKLMGFIEYPNIGSGEHNLTYYKPIIEVLQPLTYESHNNKLELWNCEPHQKHDTQPTWTWYLDIDNNVPILPILQPCNANWNIRWIKNGKIQREEKVKYFASKGKEIYIPPFLYIRNHPTKYIL